MTGTVTYRLIVFDTLFTVLGLPGADLRHAFSGESPLECVEVNALEDEPFHCEARVVLGKPRGSGRSQFNGYETRLDHSDSIYVTTTHHKLSSQNTKCTADFPTMETVTPLGLHFKHGTEYTVTANSDGAYSFVAR